MTKVRMFELWTRIIAWAVALILLVKEVRVIVQSTNSLLNESFLWIFVIATVITGILNFYRFNEGIKNNKPAN